MGVRQRKKNRNKSRFDIDAKRTRYLRNVQITPNIVCSPIQKAWNKKKPPTVNASSMGLVYKLNKYEPPVKKRHLEDTSVDEPSTSKPAKEVKMEDKKKKSKEPTTKVVQKLENMAASRIRTEHVGRLTTSHVRFATAMLDKYGDDYKAMAKDKRNYYQNTWKQIRAKIKQFTDNPKHYIPYLKARGLPTPESTEAKEGDQ